MLYLVSLKRKEPAPSVENLPPQRGLPPLPLRTGTFHWQFLLITLQPRWILPRLQEEIYSMIGQCAFLAPLTADDLLIILDSGCSIALTPYITDFIDGTYKNQPCSISGIGSGLEARGIGTVQWSLKDVNGNTSTMELTCLYVPATSCHHNKSAHLSCTLVLLVVHGLVRALQRR